MNSHRRTTSLGIAVIVVLIASFQSAAASETVRYWVYLRDKNIGAEQLNRALDEAASKLTRAARERRMKEMPALVDAFDLPVSPAYVSQIAQTGAHVRRASRWLNAVSVEATQAQAEAIRNLGFVRSVEVFRLKAMRDPIIPRRSLDELNYGDSFTQLELCRVPELHERGLSGQGVLMCMLDTGAWLLHDSFDSLRVIATYDFINGDTIVANEPEQDVEGQHYHGTAVLSAMAGYRDSVLIGPAFGADMLVAKTEWSGGEVPSEEDNYVAALEWADSLGARITSSSLGYLDWYTPSQMDGQTAVTTVAVNVAVSRGILVCTAAGNEGGNEWHIIIAPADADSILAVGAVSSEGSIVGFSSRGPTADGRIKPDVCAMGADVWCARADSNDYWLLSGTSLATPLLAGIAALVMEANPTWTAQMVRTALMETASNNETPDNDLGWGIVDAVAAADYIFDDVPEPPRSTPTSHVLISSYPNPVNGTATIQLLLPTEGAGRLTLIDALGREAYSWPLEQWQSGVNTVSLETARLATGVYNVRFSGGAGEAVRRVVILK